MSSPQSQPVVSIFTNCNEVQGFNRLALALEQSGLCNLHSDQFKRTDLALLQPQTEKHLLLRLAKQSAFRILYLSQESFASLSEFEILSIALNVDQVCVDNPGVEEAMMQYGLPVVLLPSSADQMADWLIRLKGTSLVHIGAVDFPEIDLVILNEAGNAAALRSLEGLKWANFRSVTVIGHESTNSDTQFDELLCQNDYFEIYYHLRECLDFRTGSSALIIRAGAFLMPASASVLRDLNEREVFALFDRLRFGTIEDSRIIPAAISVAEILTQEFLPEALFFSRAIYLESARLSPECQALCLLDLLLSFFEQCAENYELIYSLCLAVDGNIMADNPLLGYNQFTERKYPDLKFELRDSSAEWHSLVGTLYSLVRERHAQLFSAHQTAFTNAMALAQMQRVSENGRLSKQKLENQLLDLNYRRARDKWSETDRALIALNAKLKAQ